MTTNRPITTTTQHRTRTTRQDQEPRPLPDTDHYTEQTTRHDQQDTKNEKIKGKIRRRTPRHHDPRVPAGLRPADEQRGTRSPPR